MKMAPESVVIDNPMLAERVRNVRYEPIKYNNEANHYHQDEVIERKPHQPSKQEEKRKEPERVTNESSSKPQHTSSSNGSASVTNGANNNG